MNEIIEGSGARMTDSPEVVCGLFKYVLWECVEIYLARGWELVDSLPCHHGFYSALMMMPDSEVQP